MSTKVLLGFFLFCLDLELFPKIKKKKDLVSTDSLKPLLLITQDLNKIRKITKTLLYVLLSRKPVQNSAKNIKLNGGCSS